jgi:hypothetical protein
MSGRRAAAVLLALLVVSIAPADAASPRAIPGPRQWTDMTQGLLAVAREHRRTLEAAIPRRERDVREATASLDRNSTLYARGLITRPELDAAAREVGVARAQLDWTRQELLRTTALIVEIEARQRLASLPPLRPGQYEATEGLIRFSGYRSFSLVQLGPLEQFFTTRVGRRLPVSAAGQTDVHTRLGLDHRHAVDLALHPDSVEGRLVMSWLREQGIPFMAFRGARHGSATGAHIHVGAPSERFAAPTTRVGARPQPQAGPRADASNRAVAVPGPTTQVMTR